MAEFLGVKIKEEEEDNDERPLRRRAPSPPSPPRIDVANLLALTEDQSSKRDYPPGCPVWYNLRNTRQRRLDADRGTVESVHIDLASRYFVCKVKKKDGEDIFLMEDEFAYAHDCPVRVRGMIEGEPSKELEGRILCPRREKGKVVSYSVIFVEGGEARVELGVDPALIAYNPSYGHQLDAKQPMARELGTQSNKMPQEKSQDGEPAEVVQCSSSLANPSSIISKGAASTKSGRSGKKSGDADNANGRTEKLADGCTGALVEPRQLNRSNSNHSSTEKRPILDQPKSLKRRNSAPHKSSLGGGNASGGIQTDEPSALQLKTSLRPGSVDATVSEDHKKDQLTRARWQPPTKEPSSVIQSQKPTSQLVCHVPRWVFESTRRRLMHHIFGDDGMGSGQRSHIIERKTGCYVELGRGGRANPMTLKIKPLPSREPSASNSAKAREMLDDILMDFLECDGAKARLRYELAPGSAFEGAIVQQRSCHEPNDLVWMAILDIPQHVKHLQSFKDEVQQRVDDTQCTVQVFAQSLKNLQLPIHFCKPFVSICGEHDGGKSQVESAQSSVRNLIEEFQQHKSDPLQAQMKNDSGKPHPKQKPPSMEHNLVASRKRTPADFSSLSSNSQDIDLMARPPKTAKVASNEATCILTVPLWVSKNGIDDLFHHLIGRGGRNTKAIRSKTNCTCNLARGQSITIWIKSEAHPPSFRDVTLAKRMIVESLLEFLEDSNSESRLMYELAMTAKGTYSFSQKDGVVHQECQLTSGRLRMKLLELPSAELKNGELVPHGRFLLGGKQQQLVVDTGCSVEVYCYEDSIPILSGPYVLVCGDSHHEVKEVADRVAYAVDRHMQGCSYNCRYY